MTYLHGFNFFICNNSPSETGEGLFVLAFFADVLPARPAKWILPSVLNSHEVVGVCSGEE